MVITMSLVDKYDALFLLVEIAVAIDAVLKGKNRFGRRETDRLTKRDKQKSRYS